MRHLDLSDEEVAALTQELRATVENDRDPLSPRIRTLRGVLAKTPTRAGPRAFTAAEGRASFEDGDGTEVYARTGR